MKEENSLKDTSLSIDSEGSPLSFRLSYIKTNKLISALYIVTDIMDNNEPIRQRLRLLGSEIISDISILKFTNTRDKHIEIKRKISEIISFLDIAKTIFMISVMNSDILKREFQELQKALDDKNIDTDKSKWLSNFLMEEVRDESYENNSSFEKESLRIGVQKGSTLLKALKDIALSDRMSDKLKMMSDRNSKGQGILEKEFLSENRGNIGNDFRQNKENLKRNRRFEIVRIIKNNKGNATISEIKNNAFDVLKNCSEKTIQRELIAMVEDNVLNKTGVKRWSKYFL